jgi:tight adherence protein C
MALILIIGVLLIGATVVLLGRALVLPRLRAAGAVQQIGTYGYGSAVAAQEAAERDRSRQLADVAARVAQGLPGMNMTELRKLLFAAGMYTTAPGTVATYRVLGTLALPTLWLWLGIRSGKSPAVIVIGLILAIAVGWMGPILVIKRRAQKRLEQIDFDMPDLIDTLVTTVEAGVAFAGALQIAARRFKGPLAEELRLLLQEQNMGLGIRDALTHLLDRVETPAVRSFVRSVVQGELLGVSIGESLRTLSHEMRQRRRAAAEERAQKAPVKMLFPLAFLIFPSIFIILFAPAVYRFHDVFHH